MVVTFDREDIVGALEELAAESVAVQASSHIRIVGGAAIAMQFDRGTSTADIDALYGRDGAVEEASLRIARARGWPDT